MAAGGDQAAADKDDFGQRIDLGQLPEGVEQDHLVAHTPIAGRHLAAPLAGEAGSLDERGQLRGTA